MKILKEKFLKENETTDVIEKDVEETTTMWKVNFRLGNNNNWSRYEANTKEEAEAAVVDYITKKWPDREFEILNVVEFVEESLNESITQDAQPIEDGAKVGMASIINDLIRDEYEAIDAYNTAIVNAQAEGFEDVVRILTEIQAEENIHVGQLQEAMKVFDPNASKVEDGQAEGAEQLANPIEDSDVVVEDLDSLDSHEQELFMNCVNNVLNMSVTDWIQKYYAGKLDIIAVDSYDEIPEDATLVNVSSTDISQGTGNVIVYTDIDTNSGKLYRYASY